MILLSVLAIFVMVVASAMLSATETAITASSPGRIQKLKNQHNAKAKLVLNLLKIKEQVIATLLIGNSMFNTVCTTVATGIFIEILGDDLGTVVASVVMSFVIIVFAEVIPKAIAVVKAEQIALYSASTIVFFLRVMMPLNLLLEYLIKVFCFIFRINLSQKISGTEEVRGIIEHQHQEGNVYKSDRDMLGAVLDIRSMQISEIMIHRSDILAIDISLPTSEIVHQAISSAHTRIPLWKDNPDNIIGILHVRSLIEELYANDNDLAKIKITKLMSDPWFIPDNVLVNKQLNEFRKRKNHFACVVDEYGGLRGIVTLEDIVEEIVGQIYDEHDDVSEPVIKKDDNEFLIAGETTIRDINRELNWNLPDTHANTIAGLIIHEVQSIPNQGETIELYNMQITIIRKLRNRIKTVQVKILEILEAEEFDE